MSVKRRDKRNRVLRTGESQNSDGRYVYTYVVGKKQRKIYSWKLEPTDSLPSGKRNCVSLREKIDELNRERSMGVERNNMTVLELVERYLKTRKDVKATTKAGYKTVVNTLKKEDFAYRRISDIRMSDAKLWLVKLQDKDGKSYSSIHSIRGVLRPAFQMAVDDNVIFKNPFEFYVASVIVNDSVTREALTRDQERKFLKFVSEDKHYKRYYDAIYLLFKTGMRVSEFCGLTINDIDFKNRMISIDHQLVRVGMKYMIEETKTNAGTRNIPMSNDVYDCCMRIVENRPKIKCEPIIDGYSGFLYIDKNNMPKIALHWEKYFQRICEKYNDIYRVQMPKVTPHVCRHTFCSNMAKSGMNPKSLQYIMGHSDISVTLNTYTHIEFEDAQKEVQKLDENSTKKKFMVL